jgi:4-aminobutyrate aminotransferase-like enzyme
MNNKKIYKKNPKINKGDINKLLVFFDKKYIWHPYTQMQIWNKQDNIVMTRGDGFYLVAENGDKYLDGIVRIPLLKQLGNSFTNFLIQLYLD